MATITAVVLENTSAAAQTNVPFTFGQVFKQGDLPAGTAVALTASGGVSLPCQLNVHSTYADGSVKHASISVIVPNMAASSANPYSIATAAAHPTGAAPTPAEFSTLAAVVTITDTGTDAAGANAGTIYTASLAPKLAAGQYKTHRTGPIMADWSVRAPLLTSAGVEHPHLHARFHVLVYKGQTRAQVHFVVENTWAKPKAAMPTTGSPWELVSDRPVVYAYELRVGGQVVAKRSISGYHHVGMTFNTSGTYSNFATGIPSDSTVYTAAATIDGVRKEISLVGSAIQTYGELFAAVTAQLGGLGTAANKGNGGFRITSATTGSNSRVVIDYGTLFPALLGTGLSSSTTTPVTYTALVNINGVDKPLSIIGNQATSMARLCAIINTQLGGLGKAIPQVEAPGLRIVATSTGTTAGVTITDTNLISKIAANALKHRRPFRGDEYIHYANTRWKMTFWSGTAPATHVRQDKAYWTATNAYPNYPASLTGDPATIEKNKVAMAANSDIGTNGITKAYMGDTGYAPGIGILPEWTALFIVNQGKDAWDVMLKQADLQGSWAMHVREYDTDLPISFIKWPKATFSPTAADSKNPLTGLNEKIPSTFIPSYLPTNNNSADVSHHPDFSTVPWLATGDLFYLESLLMHHNFTILDMNAAGSYRDGGKMIFKGQSQVRGQAWSFRTLVHALFSVPDDHPQRTTMQLCMNENLQWYNSRYVDPAGTLRNVFGHLNGIIYSRNGVSRNSYAPWQDDFVTMSFGRAVELGYREFLPLLTYKSEQIRGRLTSGPDFCWYLASNYTLQVRDSETSPQYSTWAEVYNKGFSAAITSAACGSPEFAAAIGEKVGGMSGYPTTISGFPSNMQPAIAYCATYKMPGCEDAWLVFDSRALKPDYNLGPQWGIEPRSLTAVELPELPPVEILRAGASGLGGAVASVSVGSALFGKVDGQTSKNGKKEYFCAYIKNNLTKTIKTAVYWISANTPSPGTTIRVGKGTSAVGGVEQTIASSTTAPVGVAFSLAGTKAAGVALGDIPAGGTVAVWYERDTLPGTKGLQNDTFTHTLEGSVLK